jgi:hypothetical protein
MNMPPFYLFFTLLPFGLAKGPKGLCFVPNPTVTSPTSWDEVSR